ncbi:hypothetical protein N181_01205 [Sinorhizobium fredii USDA 205]|uniref:Uncharacterized protein n=2 Tax=Rhizobium fredii TaxID=380 RepID=A0A844AC86_RHIFR|nr:hypothetical protein [Sinorhizobium fredii]AWM23586.1 hypothetical protein AOX55_0000305 [Sinorhizobium fredii CCBAU 25509]KSV92753.1 hypothetical protein N181_01205 [Sinorhizobium fredii USDA 205]MCG5476335.1 hypothetical protein [Sinorhizobium fredii]MQW96306.1 hypothetical protein [Sinorhizobium fredii]MQX10784.1 hypothetical protein [Sinorhizobium fredii]
MTIEIAVIARIAMVAALIPRTIIAHTRGRIFMMSPCAYDGAACAVRAHLTFDSILDDK